MKGQRNVMLLALKTDEGPGDSGSLYKGQRNKSSKEEGRHAYTILASWDLFQTSDLQNYETTCAILSH